MLLKIWPFFLIRVRGQWANGQVKHSMTWPPNQPFARIKRSVAIDPNRELDFWSNWRLDRLSQTLLKTLVSAPASSRRLHLARTSLLPRLRTCLVSRGAFKDGESEREATNKRGKFAQWKPLTLGAGNVKIEGKYPSLRWRSMSGVEWSGAVQRVRWGEVLDSFNADKSRGLTQRKKIFTFLITFFWGLDLCAI